MAKRSDFYEIGAEEAAVLAEIENDEMAGWLSGIGEGVGCLTPWNGPVYETFDW